MNVVAWMAFGAMAGYTALYLAPVDPSIGRSRQALVGILGALAAGWLACLLFAVDPFGARIDMLPGWASVIGAIVSIVGREEARERPLVWVHALTRRR